MTPCCSCILLSNSEGMPRKSLHSTNHECKKKTGKFSPSVVLCRCFLTVQIGTLQNFFFTVLIGTMQTFLQHFSNDISGLNLIYLSINLMVLLGNPAMIIHLQSDPLNSYSLNSSFSLNSSGNLETLKALSLTPMVNYPLNSSPCLVHRKTSAYFSNELSGSNCNLELLQTANQRRKVQLQALQTAMMVEMKLPTRMMITQVEVMPLLLSLKFSQIHLMSCQILQSLQ